MTSREKHDSDSRHRALMQSSAQRRAEHLRGQQVTREQERASMLEADATKTARLRALRLAKEAADAEPATVALKGVRAEA